jgi:hypothetical protein
LLHFGAQAAVKSEKGCASSSVIFSRTLIFIMSSRNFLKLSRTSLG